MTDRPFDFLYENPDKPTEPTHIVAWGQRYQLYMAEYTDERTDWDYCGIRHRVAIRFDARWEPVQEPPKRVRRRQSDLGLRRPK